MVVVFRHQGDSAALNRDYSDLNQWLRANDFVSNDPYPQNWDVEPKFAPPRNISLTSTTKEQS